MADPDPYIRCNRDDIIKSDDWNNIQSKARGDIYTHNHTGGEKGVLLAGEAIDPNSIVTLKQLDVTDSLAVNNRDVLAVIDALAGRVGAVENAPDNLPMTGGTITGNLSVLGTLTAAGRITQEDWRTPEPLLGGWVRYQTTYNNFGFFKDTCGVVHLRGVLKNGVIGQPIFTLPEGYRPQHNELFVVASNGYGRVDVMSDGRIIAVVGNPGWLSLDGLSFRAYP